MYITFKAERPVFESAKDYRQFIASNLFEYAVGRRLNIIAHLNNPPFYSAHVLYDEPVSTCCTFDLTASITDSATLALETLLTEIARVRTHGFSAWEIEVAKAKVRAEVDQRYIPQPFYVTFFVGNMDRKT